MVREFKLPDVGEGLTEAEIVRWLVEPGDPVTEDQPVAEVETDKAVVEVPAPVNGTVKEILAEEGEMVPVGEVIITFEVEGEAPTEGEAELDVEPADAGEDAVEAAAEPGAGAEADTPETPEGRVFASPSARRLARELGVDIASVDGSAPGGRVTDADVRTTAEAGEEATADDAPVASAGGDGAATAEGTAAKTATRRVTEEPGATAAADTDGVDVSGVESADRARTLAAPATRRLAEERGVDIDAVPTDETRDGEPFVTPEQVEQYAEAQQRAQAAEAEAVAGGAAAGAGGEAAGAEAGVVEGVTAPDEDERIPYRGIRRTIGQQMERSKFTAPHVTHHDDADVTQLVETRERLKGRAEERGSRLTYMPFVVKAIVAALKQHRVLNSQLDEENEEIVLRGDYNIGIATATDAGLMVPVVKHAGRKGMLELGEEMRELIGKARDRSIAREEMQGGTFTITNFGAIGGEYATPIINYPETAILGLGAIKDRPRVVDGEVVPRKVITLSLSIDHRVIDGADAAQFVNTLKEYLENPELLLLE